MKPWETKKSKLTDFLRRTGHLKSVYFRTNKVQLLIVWLSQDLVSVNIFESEHHCKYWNFFFCQRLLSDTKSWDNWTIRSIQFTLVPCSPKKVGQLDFFGFQGFIISIPNPNIKGCPGIVLFVDPGKDDQGSTIFGWTTASFWWWGYWWFGISFGTP